MSAGLCSSCPVHDNIDLQVGLGMNIEAERTIRRDERRLLVRELQVTARDLAWFLDQLDPHTSGLPVKTVETLDKIRRHTQRLITQAERKAA